MTIPSSVTSIGNSAFKDCSGLTSVTMPNSVTSIGYAAFAGCSGIESAVVPACVLGFDWLSSTFPDNKCLQRVEIADGVTSIVFAAFAGCSCLTAVTTPNSVTSIGMDAFFGCSSLTSLTIPSSVTSIGYSAFGGSALTTVLVNQGGASRVKKLFQDSNVGVDTDKLSFVEMILPFVAGDDGTTVTGDAETGWTDKPSESATEVVVTIPDGVDAKKVTVKVSPETQTVTPNGAVVKVVRGEADITDFLDIPTADASGVLDLSAATVKEEIAKEPFDAAKGAKVDFSSPTAPSLTTAPTREGLVYRLKEGATLEAMAADADGEKKIGDGTSWTPTLSVTGGASGFYTIEVGK